MPYVKNYDQLKLQKLKNFLKTCKKYVILIYLQLKLEITIVFWL